MRHNWKIDLTHLITIRTKTGKEELKWRTLELRNLWTEKQTMI